MKVKKQRNINTILLTAILILVSLWIAYNYIKSLELQLTLQHWLMIGSFLGVVFVVVDTIEIILLRQGQRKWTHTPGETMGELVDDLYEYLKKNPVTMQKMMIISANLFEAGMQGVPEESEGKNSNRGLGPKIEVKNKTVEAVINHPRVKRKLFNRLDEFLDGKKKKKVAEISADVGIDKYLK